jgi:hypothetical protein
MPPVKHIVGASISVSIVASSLLFAKTDEARMNRSYTKTPDGAFILKHGVTAKATFDRQGGACAIVLFGAMSEDEVLKTFDLLVPANTRGSNTPHQSLVCAGACLKSTIYKKVELVTGSFGHANSDPAARITFRRSACTPAVVEAQKQIWHLKQIQNSKRAEEPARK